MMGARVLNISALLHRRGMADLPQARARLIRCLAGFGVENQVLAAMAQVPRHAFLPPSHAAVAYTNQCACIGDINLTEPLAVARMTQHLRLTPAARVLEIGTGTGYHTAVLAFLAGQVFTVERVPALVRRSCEAFVVLGLDNVRQRQGDGARGWPEAAPFQAIIATAAAARVPDALVQQLDPRGGRLVMPVGGCGGPQRLCLIQRWQTRTEMTDLGPACFVPFVPDTAVATKRGQGLQGSTIRAAAGGHAVQPA